MTNQLMPAFEKVLHPALTCPRPPVGDAKGGKLDVAVVFTSADATLRALRRAGELANELNARILLLVPQIVPFPLPLTSPPVLLDFQEQRLRAIAEDSRVPTTVRIYLCRDRWGLLSMILKPASLIVVGGSRQWWRTREQRLASRLRKAGHQVVFAEME